MNEPLVISFNRQVGQSIYLFWLVEPADMGVVMGAICLNMMMFENYGLFLWTILGYFTYVMCLRAGRPRGYDHHFFAELTASTYLRPGRADAHDYIRPPKEDNK
jgi:hypothetical protein